MSLFFGLSLQMQTRALRVRCSKIKLFEADLWTWQVVGKKVDIREGEIESRLYYTEKFIMHSI